MPKKDVQPIVREVLVARNIRQDFGVSPDRARFEARDRRWGRDYVERILQRQRQGGVPARSKLNFLVSDDM